MSSGVKACVDKAVSELAIDSERYASSGPKESVPMESKRWIERQV
jgi:hypothetical protein